MAVKIRLKKMGSKKRPFYRLVAADSRFPRDGRFLETLGYYNPMVEPADIRIDEDKVYKWLRNGAKPSVNAGELLRSAGIMERWQLLKEGVSIPELDAKIEERRAKQPKAQPKDKKKISKKAAAAAAKAAEEKEKAEEKTEEKSEDAPEEEAAGAPAEEPGEEEKS